MKMLVITLMMLLPAFVLGGDLGVGPKISVTSPDLGLEEPDLGEPLSLEIPAEVVAPGSHFPGDPPPIKLVIEQGKDVVAAAQAAKKAPNVASIAAAIAAGIMLLISLARRFGGLLLTPHQVRVFVVVASAIAGGAAQVTEGMELWEVFIIALSPVMSVGAHQVFVKPISKKSKQKN